VAVVPGGVDAGEAVDRLVPDDAEVLVEDEQAAVVRQGDAAPLSVVADGLPVAASRSAVSLAHPVRKRAVAPSRTAGARVVRLVMDNTVLILILIREPTGR
jgi:hypothetical protein